MGTKDGVYANLKLMLNWRNQRKSLFAVITSTSYCVINIKSWMTANILQLNMDKTEVLVLMNKSLRNPNTISKIKIDSIDISPAKSVRNFGAIFDSALSKEAFVNFILKSAWFNIFNIKRSRTSLTTDAAKILIQAYVMSKIDYCHSLLYGIPDKLWTSIQRIQKYASGVVLGLHKSSYITPTLATIHWLNVNRRIDFKIASLVYKAPNGQAPAYIADLLLPYDPSPEGALGWQATPFTADLSLWNNIPHSVRHARHARPLRVLKWKQYTNRIRKIV